MAPVERRPGCSRAPITGAVTAIDGHYDIGSTGPGFVVSSTLPGAPVGAFVAGRVADRFGRLTAMRLAAVMSLASALVSGCRCFSSSSGST